MKRAIAAFKAGRDYAKDRSGWHTTASGNGTTVLGRYGVSVLVKRRGAEWNETTARVDPADPAWRYHRKALLAFGIHVAQCPSAPGFVLVCLAPCVNGVPLPIGSRSIWTTHIAGFVPVNDEDEQA